LRRFELFAKQFPAGSVTLGPAAAPTANADMYTIIVP
jgi:hypothetical protein